MGQGIDRLHTPPQSQSIAAMAREQLLDSRQERLDEYNDALKARRADQELALRKVQETISARERKLRELEGRLREQAGKLEARRSELSAWEHSFASREQQLQQREAQLQHQHQLMVSQLYQYQMAPLGAPPSLPGIGAPMAAPPLSAGASEPAEGAAASEPLAGAPAEAAAAVVDALEDKRAQQRLRLSKLKRLPNKGQQPGQQHAQPLGRVRTCAPAAAQPDRGGGPVVRRRREWPRRLPCPWAIQWRGSLTRSSTGTVALQ